MYRRFVPYPARYAIALAAWLLLLAFDALLRFCLVCCIPIVFVMSRFGANQTQVTAQAYADIADGLIRPLPRLPRLGRRAADSGSVAIE